MLPQPRQNLVPHQTVRQPAAASYASKRGRPPQAATARPQPPQPAAAYRTVMRPPSPQKQLAMKPPSPPKPPQQILQSEPDMAELITTDNLGGQLSLDDIVEQMGVGARPHGNSLICLFCMAPYTPEDYQ